MHPTEYEQELTEFLNAIKDKAMRKLKEYGSPTDALESIKLQAQAEGRSPEGQAYSLMGKHHMSLGRYVACLDKGGDWKAFCDNLTEPFDEKLIDEAVYTFIQHALHFLRKKGRT